MTRPSSSTFGDAMFEGISGIVLDIDDTLYLERDYVLSGFNAVERWLRETHGIEGVGALAWAFFKSGRRRTTIGDALRELECGPELLPPCVEVYRRHPPSITFCSDAADFVQRAVDRYPLGVVTDGPLESQQAKAKALGLDSYASPIIYSAATGRTKPDPTLFSEAAANWHIPNRSMAYIGDNPHKDFDGPLALGWSCVRVRRKGSLHYATPTPAGVLEVPDLNVPITF